MNQRRFHFIAIGGSIMHALAIALKEAGHLVTGSDDAVYGVSRKNLKKAGLLPGEGWDPSKLDKSIDTVILGMHAREDNPELLKSRELGLPILSFPEFLFNYAKDKTRVVIGGSHGKSTITAMCIHALEKAGKQFDYIIGAPPAEGMPLVRLSEAPIMLFEGDEYLTSALDPTPKFLHYHHHTGLLSGIEWDHANVFPTFEKYVEEFRKFVALTPRDGSIIYNSEDEVVENLVKNLEISCQAYGTPEYTIKDGKTVLEFEGAYFELAIFGKHNLMNLNGASYLCETLGIRRDDFFASMRDFTGAGRRLQVIIEGKNRIFNDFAHSPSKVRATVAAVAEQYPGIPLVAILEIHTFSSLNKSFLPMYKDTLAPASKAYVYFDPEVVKTKKLEKLTKREVSEFFGNGVRVLTSPNEIEEEIRNEKLEGANYLFMSSGNFGGLNMNKLANELT